VSRPTDNQKLPRVYSVKDAIELSGRSDASIRRDIKKGALPAHKIGASVRIREKDLREYLGDNASD
jgi:excisionase family DNA binding protein